MSEIESTSASSPAVIRRLSEIEGRLGDLSDRLEQRLDRVLQGVELIIDDDPRARRELARLRAGDGYEAAFSAPSPLVSVLIPTYDRTTSLCERAIPSVLAQTHANVEAVVVGDGSPPDLVEAMRTFSSEPRVHFHNRTVQGPYPDDPFRAWCASGTPPLNEAQQVARGEWLTALGDDDEMAPTHVERLLAVAQRERLEFVYGTYRQFGGDGSHRSVGAFPPQLGSIGLQMSLWHSGLRFLEFELAHALFMTPNDWGLIRRMMRIGVRIGRDEDIVVDFHPSGRSVGWDVPPADERADLRQNVADLRGEVEALRLRCEETNAQLATVLGSRSWRLAERVRATVRRGRGG